MAAKQTSIPRVLIVPVLITVALVLAADAGPQARAMASAAAQAGTHVVWIVDNSAPPASTEGGRYFFYPAHLEVQRGDTIVFDNESTNFRPHTLTSIQRVGAPFPMTVLASGTLFDSSPTPDRLVLPGSTFELNTSSLSPGNYTYFCKLHPWMVANFTVE